MSENTKKRRKLKCPDLSLSSSSSVVVVVVDDPWRSLLGGFVVEEVRAGRMISV